MRSYLEKLIAHDPFSKKEYCGLAEAIFQEEADSVLIMSALTLLAERGLHCDLLTGFQEVLQQKAIPLSLQAAHMLDVCGTGGDGKSSFNISTLAAFVLAGAGIKIAKHGNYGLTSVSGSSTVLEMAGVFFTSDPGTLQRSLDEAGICVLHAPLFHPAFKKLAPIRRALPFPTIFNVLGPLLNPARPTHQVIGVSSPVTLRVYTSYFNSSEQVTLLRSLDGYDEVSLTAPCLILRGRIQSLFSPGSLGFKTISPEVLHGGGTKESHLKVFIDILECRGGKEQREVVLINAAIGYQTVHPHVSREDALAHCRESLESRKAYRSFMRMKETYDNSR